MPHKPLVLANWKMNLGVAESVTLARAMGRAYVAAKLGRRVELAVAPAFPALAVVRAALGRSGIGLAAQDAFWKAAGPYTGEVSPAMLRELNVRYVIVGHSERRQYLKETDAMVQQKVLACLAHGLVPVVCVGETLAERQAGQAATVVTRQLTAALSGVTLAAAPGLVVAYEPVWVIGTGKAITPHDAEAVATVLRRTLVGLFSAAAVRRQARLVYGGSVDPTNIRAFVDGGLVSGVLVGGASLEAKRFAALLQQL